MFMGLADVAEDLGWRSLYSAVEAGEKDLGTSGLEWQQRKRPRYAEL